jgi:hypothetical protein
MTVSLVNEGPYTILLDSEILEGPRKRAGVHDYDGTRELSRGE